VFVNNRVIAELAWCAAGSGLPSGHVMRRSLMSRKSTLSVADLQAAYVREYGETPQQTLAARAYWAQGQPLPDAGSSGVTGDPCPVLSEDTLPLSRPEQPSDCGRSLSHRQRPLTRPIG